MPVQSVPSLRDPAGWKALRGLAHRRLERHGDSRCLRAWVPLCSNGEEAYSIAIRLFESLGTRWREVQLRVFCTDTDGRALSVARAGRYSRAAARRISPDALERFFIHGPNGLTVRPFVRDACRFAHHEAGRTPPFSRLDLIALPSKLEAASRTRLADVLRSTPSVLAQDGILVDAGGPTTPDMFGPAGASDAALDTRGGDERFQALLAQLPEAVLVRDSETDLVLDANEAARVLFGRSLPDLLGMRVEELMLAPDKVRRPSGERRSEERLRLPHFKRKDGTAFPSDMKKSFVMVRGRPCELWVLTDATPRLRGDLERRRADAQHDSMEEVVHELKSPVSIIRGFAETLRKGVRRRRDRAEFLTSIETHAGRLSKLVDRLLNVSAAESSSRATQPAPVLLSDAIWEIAKAFVPVARKRGVSLKIDVPADLVVTADPADLPHIFGNLFDNAIKFNHRGGRVAVGARLSGKEAVVSVSDGGPGIPPAELHRVFDRMFRSASTRRTKGTGLGLAIVRGMVQANGGRIVADNEPTGGAVFHVTLPLAAAEARG